jgi:hypothetical protein
MGKIANKKRKRNFEKNVRRKNISGRLKKEKARHLLLSVKKRNTSTPSGKKWVQKLNSSQKKIDEDKAKLHQRNSSSHRCPSYIKRQERRKNISVLSPFSCLRKFMFAGKLDMGLSIVKTEFGVLDLVIGDKVTKVDPEHLRKVLFYCQSHLKNDGLYGSRLNEITSISSLLKFDSLKNFK